MRTDFIDLANRVNDEMPTRVLSRVTRTLNADHLPLKSARVGLLGVAYKKNSSDIRESPAVALLDSLQRSRAAVSYHDPHVPVLGLNGQEIRSESLTPSYLASLDCVVITADHDDIHWSPVKRHAARFVDTRNVLGSAHSL